MAHCYIKIGINMNQEELLQVKKDIENLGDDIKKLIGDLSNVSKEGAMELKAVGTASLEKVLEQVNSSKDKVGKTTDYLLCKTKCTLYERPFTCLGLAAIIGIVVGAMMTKK